MKEIRKNRVNINSVILGSYLCIPMITKILTSIVKIDNNIIIITGILLLCSLCVNWNKIKLDKTFVIINSVIFVFFIASFFMIDNKKSTIYYALSYILYGIIGVFFIQQRHRRIKVFKAINLTFVLYTVILVTYYIPLFLKRLVFKPYNGGLLHISNRNNECNTNK